MTYVEHMINEFADGMKIEMDSEERCLASDGKLGGELADGI